MHYVCWQVAKESPHDTNRHRYFSCNLIILPDNTYTHVNHGSQTRSWLDHIAMSDVLSKSIVDCHTLQDVACSDHCAVTVTLNLDQLPMSHNVERQRAKQINWKFE